MKHAHKHARDVNQVGVGSLPPAGPALHNPDIRNKHVGLCDLDIWDAQCSREEGRVKHGITAAMLLL